MRNEHKVWPLDVTAAKKRKLNVNVCKMGNKRRGSDRMRVYLKIKYHISEKQHFEVFYLNLSKG